MRTFKTGLCFISYCSLGFCGKAWSGLCPAVFSLREILVRVSTSGHRESWGNSIGGFYALLFHCQQVALRSSIGSPSLWYGLYYADNHDQCRYEQQGGSHWRVSAMLIGYPVHSAGRYHFVSLPESLKLPLAGSLYLILSKFWYKSASSHLWKAKSV